MTKTTSAVELTSVTKFFDQRKAVSLFKRQTTRVWALRDISFSLNRGEIAAYAGPNGAGKSTTFKLLAGMLLPQEGTVSVLGMDPARERIAIMRRTGVLFGNRSELWWDHPVRASFTWKKEVWEIEDSVYEQNVRELTELLGLQEIWNTFARELSLGQRMRANLALTMLHSPELVLLDEPTLGLDVLAKRQMIDFIRRVNADKGVTFLVTSHDMGDLNELAERILLINRGRLAFDGSYEDLVRMTGDTRVIRIRTDGQPPKIPGTEYLGEERGQYIYRYDALKLSAEKLFLELSEVPNVQDLELAREGIEPVIARLYQSWGSAAGEMDIR